jgi:hypothetical protein
VIAGCQKPGPIEVVDPQLHSQSLELDNSTFSSPEFFGIEGVDSGSVYPATRLSPAGNQMSTAQFLVTGVQYDALLEHHEASLARVIMFDRTQIIVIGTDTIFRTIDAGRIRFDGLEMFKIPTKYYSHSAGFDTVIGLQYMLLSKDGIGGRGFRYFGNHLYQWESSGSPQLSAFSINGISSRELHVTSPTPRDVIVASRNLPVMWEGGASAVHIIISNLQPGGTPKPLFHMKVNTNRGSIIIPSTVLQILPKDRNAFLFSFISDLTTMTQISGYPGDVVLQTISIHNLVLQVAR